jgi:predicted secreted hydrolase
VSTKDFELNLDLATTQPPLLQGVAGFSQKGPDVRSSSYYYSMPQLRVSGQVRTQEGVREVHGVAWLDHEWSSSLMDEQAQGWDWLGLNLDDGGALMVFRMRDAKGEPHWAAAKRRKASGASYELISYAREALEWKVLRTWRSPHTGVEYPVEWQLRVGDDTLVLRPLMDDQENDSRGSTGTIYYEGAVRAFDSTGHTIGRGYLELTGYGSRMKL